MKSELFVVNVRIILLTGEVVTGAVLTAYVTLKVRRS